jgi:hypothetical protein
MSRTKNLFRAHQASRTLAAVRAKLILRIRDLEQLGTHDAVDAVRTQQFAALLDAVHALDAAVSDAKDTANAALGLP